MDFLRCACGVRIDWVNNEVEHILYGEKEPE